MKVYILTILVVITLSGLAAAQSGQRVSLQTGEKKGVVGRKLVLKFVSVIEDSRCPVGQVCVWAGNAKVKIQVGRKGGVMNEFDVNSTVEPQSIRYKGYAIKLASLSPRPGENPKPIAAKNTAVFEITKF